MTQLLTAVQNGKKFHENTVLERETGGKDG